MKSLFFLIVIAFFQVPDNQPVLEYSVEGRITTSSNYCGGAAPDPDMLRELQTPRGFYGKQLYVRKGKSNDLSMPIIDTIVADSGGYFKIQLPAGTYTIISDLHLDQSILNRDFGGNIMVTPGCLENWWNKGLQTITVEGDISGNDFHFTDRCFVPLDIPCLQYTGPYPP